MPLTGNRASDRCLYWILEKEHKNEEKWNGSSLVLSPGFWQSGAWESRRAEKTCTGYVTPLTLCSLSPQTKTKIWAVLPTGNRCVGGPGNCRAVYPGALDLGISGSKELADSCSAFARLRALTCAICSVPLDLAMLHVRGEHNSMAEMSFAIMARDSDCTES